MLLFSYQKKNNPASAKDDLQLVDQIRNGNEKAFEDLFFEYHGQLSRFAFTITKSREFARDAIQDVFFKIWRNRESLMISHSIKVYLYQSVRNQCLNLLEKQRTQRKLVDSIQRDFNVVDHGEEDPLSHLSEHQKELIREIWKVAEQMPQRRRLVFELHRKHGFSYKEIAQILEISLKTVENHMGHALQFIRENIKTK